MKLQRKALPNDKAAKNAELQLGYQRAPIRMVSSLI
jgi:hypothetical protein